MSEIVIRCDASPTIGLGHLTRSIALAQAFRDDLGLDTRLLMRHDATALGIAQRAEVAVSILPTPGAAADAVFASALAAARALVLDYRGDLDDTVLADASARGVVIATIDDPTPRRLLADLAFYPPIPQVAEWSWSGFRGELLAGWEWVVLRRDLGPARIDRMTESPRMLISLGGSDPQDMSSLVVRALAAVTSPCRPLLVIGPANTRRDALRTLAGSREVPCVDSPENFTDLVSNADIAVISFGVTAYELAASQVPALHLCLTEDHANSASVFERAGIARIIGTYPVVTIERTSECLQAALDAYTNPQSWVHNLPRPLDTSGATRVARRIASRLDGH